MVLSISESTSPIFTFTFAEEGNEGQEDWSDAQEGDGDPNLGVDW